MKLIRASRGIYVPHDPEKPDKNAMRLVQTGLIAIIPDNFVLPEDSYVELQDLHIKKPLTEKVSGFFKK